MRAAIISYTENGRRLSLKIAEILGNSTRLCFKSHADEQCEVFNSTDKIVEKLWRNVDALVFVCACGIAVRAISRHIRSKLTDPAVVVVDDCGRFVIPVLSGHIGGANALAERLAESLGAQAVITTATDIGGHFSPDSFAAANDLIIADISAAKAIASAVLDGETIGLVSEFEVMNLPEKVKIGEEHRCGIYIGRNTDISPFEVTLSLAPWNVVLGIGCKKGTTAGTIVETVDNFLRANNIPWERVCKVATIDMKSQEIGLLQFCSERGLSVDFYTAEQLVEVDGEFSTSAFVKSVTGVDNVCERAAVLCSGGRLIARKFAENGVTAAAAERAVRINFERKIL